MGFHYYTVYKKKNTAVYTSDHGTMKYLQDKGFTEFFQVNGAHISLSSNTVDFTDGRTYMKEEREKELQTVQNIPARDLPILMGSLTFPASVKLLERRLRRA